MQGTAGESSYSVIVVVVDCHVTSDVELSNPDVYTKIMLPFVSATRICAYPEAPTVISHRCCGLEPINNPAGES